jgi:fructan beta-fructosidase
MKVRVIISCLLLLATVGYSQKLVNSDTVRQIKIKKGDRYLTLPVKDSNPLVRARILLNGKALDQFTIRLSERPDYWTFFDVTPYQGKTLTFEVSKVPVGGGPGSQPAVPVIPVSTGQREAFLNMITSDVKYPGQDSLYTEKGRPLAHFTASRGWINDPNGLIYYNGAYHMYFQHNPYGWAWGNMHWGHAVSKDLIHWEQLPEALYPWLGPTENNRNDAAFSGSAVTDPTNTSGFSRNGVNPLIAFYTSTGRGECIKLSYDNGKTFEDYSGNPILKHNGRDPKVFWYAPGKHWVMVVWESGMPKKLSLEQEASIREHSIYTSPDLKSWTYQSGVSGFFECPELFELPVEGQSGVSKWVMYDAHGRYVVGDFDGKKFNVEQPFRVYAHGGGYFYASQLFNDTPDGKRIQVGWGRNITNPGMPFNQPMLFPTELKLRKSFDGLRLTPKPIAAISTLHTNTKVIENKVISAEKAVVETNAKALHVVASIERGDAPISLNVMGFEFRFDNEWMVTTATNEEVKPTTAPAGPFPPPSAAVPVTYVPSGNEIKFEVILDKNIMECFINDGELYYVTAFNGVPTGKVEVGVPGRSAQGRNSNRKFILKKLEVHELDGIWKKQMP